MMSMNEWSDEKLSEVIARNIISELEAHALVNYLTEQLKTSKGFLKAIEITKYRLILEAKNRRHEGGV